MKTQTEYKPKYSLIISMVQNYLLSSTIFDSKEFSSYFELEPLAQNKIPAILVATQHIKDHNVEVKRHWSGKIPDKENGFFHFLKINPENLQFLKFSNGTTKERLGFMLDEVLNDPRDLLRLEEITDEINESTPLKLHLIKEEHDFLNLFEYGYQHRDIYETPNIKNTLMRAILLPEGTTSFPEIIIISNPTLEPLKFTAPGDIYHKIQTFDSSKIPSHLKLKNLGHTQAKARLQSSKILFYSKPHFLHLEKEVNNHLIRYDSYSTDIGQITEESKTKLWPLIAYMQPYYRELDKLSSLLLAIDLIPPDMTENHMQIDPGGNSFLDLLD